MMAETNYPKLKQHRMIHEAFKKKVWDISHNMEPFLDKSPSFKNKFRFFLF